jgi:hypothetical protein
MSAFPSNYIVNKINDHIYKGTAISLGSTRYLALYKTDPTAADTGTEASGGSYARQSVTMGSSSSGTTTNTNTLTYSAMSSGTYTHYGVRDALSAGNLIVYGALPNPIIANTGDDITIAAGGISFSLSGS